MVVTCHVSDPNCAELAVFRLGTVCVHEHIIKSVACARHARQAKRRGVTCYLCATGPEPHQCEARLINPEGGATRWGP